MSLKIIFPNGDHPERILVDGVTRIGADSGNEIHLEGGRMPPMLCEIRVQGEGAALNVPKLEGAPAVSVNGRPVDGAIALRVGDQLRFGAVLVRVVPVEPPPVAGLPEGLGEDTGATRVRMAVPKYVLRGLSGPIFGKMFPVPGQVVLGRQPECDIPLTAGEISRRHAQLKPTADGVAVEDLGSANGTYVNGQRVQQAIMKPGDELRLDTLRFMLITPGMDITGSTPKVEAGVVANARSRWMPVLIAAAVIAAAAVAAVILL